MVSTIPILMAGGGTGGHLWPGVVLAQTLQALYPPISATFFVPGRPVDWQILDTTSFTRYANAMMGFPTHILQIPKFTWRFVKGWYQTWRLFRHLQPKLVVGLGGYGAWSAGVLAHHYHIPLVLLESNCIAGKVVRWLSPYCISVYTSGLVTGIPANKIKPLGIPIRDNLPIEKPLGISPKTYLTILIMGGSQGAEALNTAISKTLPQLQDLSSKIQFIHLTGKNTTVMQAHYTQYGFQAQVYPFYSNMAELYLKTDLIICRAGGGTLAEITAMGLPSILVPLPSAAEQHQQANAIPLVQAGAAKLVAENQLTQQLAGIIRTLWENPNELACMANQSRLLGKPQAAKQIATELGKLLSLG